MTGATGEGAFANRFGRSVSALPAACIESIVRSLFRGHQNSVSRRNLRALRRGEDTNDGNGREIRLGRTHAYRARTSKTATHSPGSGPAVPAETDSGLGHHGDRIRIREAIGDAPSHAQFRAPPPWSGGRRGRARSVRCVGLRFFAGIIRSLSRLVFPLQAPGSEPQQR